MVFWIVSGALALVVSIILGLTLLRGRVGDKPPAAYDLQVYRDQLKEVDRDLARGVVGPEDAERTRAEISRRVLSADAQLREGGDSGGQPSRGGRVAALLLVLVLAAGSVGLYSQLGAPGYSDLPLKSRVAQSDAARANRLAQAEIEAQMPAADLNPEATPQFLELMERLRDTVEKRPDDLRGLTLLARNEAALGDYKAAYAAQQRIIDVKSADASASDYTYLAELMVSAAGAMSRRMPRRRCAAHSNATRATRPRAITSGFT